MSGIRYTAEVSFVSRAGKEPSLRFAELAAAQFMTGGSQAMLATPRAAATTAEAL